MTPFADWTFFGVLLIYAVLPVCVLGWMGKASARRSFIASLLVLGFIYSAHSSAVLRISGLLLPGLGGAEILRPWERQEHAVQFAPFYVFLLAALWQCLVCAAFLRWKNRATFYLAVLLALVPLLASKVLPFISVDNAFGFLGVSYVMFRALDVVFSIQDGVIKTLAPGQLFAFLFFFPTVSAGPIDRYRRFGLDWAKERNRAEFLDDLDFAVQRIMRGFLYKFIIAALIDKHWQTPLEKASGLWATAGSMYSYTAYLFFDFAGYSAFAVGVSRLLGIRTPENFDAPFLARNIREFWARWHQSLSFWFRDHVHMRFQLAAAKGKWFKAKTTAGYIGTFLTFGIMGVWHGFALHYIIYGLYHAILVSGYDWFARWNKQAKRIADTPRNRVFARLITFHIVAFGMLIFSGRIVSPPPPIHEEKFEITSSGFVEGYVWRRNLPNGGLDVDIFVDWKWAMRVHADIERTDLRERKYGNGKHGFRADLSKWRADGMSHAVEVRIVGSNQPLGKAKKMSP